MPSTSTRAKSDVLGCYQLFDLLPSASREQIRKRYHELARRWHPDNFLGRDGLSDAEERMKAVNAAYLLIKDAPLAGRRPARGHGYGSARSTGARFMSWLRSVEREEPGVPDGTWERDCPNCGTPVEVEGCRYKYCPSCGAGFFPDLEGARHEWYPTSEADRKRSLVDVALWALWAALWIVLEVLHFSLH